MRTGVSTVQQTLTNEAANVLKLAVAEAQRRGHAQVTPLHVATTLLSGSSSVLRQACVQSHLHLPQPPHCRNLELCFKVALDRLQTSSSATTTTTTTANSTTSSPSSPSSSSPTTNLALHHHHHHHHQHHLHLQQQHQQQQQHHLQQQPALSNALVAALKRAQAHQRRGYPEQQQVPLLAVKVEMEQLIISILDDPSVSRVMREASFSSTQVKNSLEEALAAAASSASAGSSTCAAQARRILPAAAAAAASLIVVTNPCSAGGGASNVDRLRLKLGSLEQYAAASLSFQHGRNSSNNFIIPGLNRNSSSSSNTDHPHHHHQLSNVLMTMPIPPPPASSNLINNSSSSIGSSSSSSSRSSVDVGRVLEILLKSKKRNPLLFGEQSPHAVAEEVMNRLEKGDCSEPCLRNLRIVSPQFASIALGLHGRDEVEQKLGELVRAVEKNLLCSSGVVVYLGDLQWLVERSSPPPAAAAGSNVVFCPVQHAVTEIGKLLLEQGNRVWLMGVASSQTYMRCQARHPSLDTVWGLQPLPISTFSLTLRNSNVNRFAAAADSAPVRPPAAGGGRWPMLPFKLQAGDENLENCCAECVVKYEQELRELEKNLSSSEESTTTTTTNNGLPFWLKPNKDPPPDLANGRSQKLKELQKRWSQTCRSAHGSSNLREASIAAAAGGKVSTCSTAAGGRSSLPMSIPWLSLQPQIISKGLPEKSGITALGHGKDVGSVCSSSPEDVLSTEIGLSLKPGAAVARSSTDQQQQQQQEMTVQTDLVLGRSSDKSSSNGSVSTGKVNSFLDSMIQRERLQNLAPFPATTPEKQRVGDGIEKKQLPAVLPPPLITAVNNSSFKPPPPKELDFKALCKALADGLPWQREAVGSIASTVLHCRSGAEKRRKCDTWLLFLGPDAMAKRKVARILAEQVFGSDRMLFRLSLRSQAEKLSRGQEREADANAAFGRGRTPLDRLADAVRSKPFSVILLEDIEQADPRLKTALMKAAEKGRLTDSSGREVSVANSIVVMTSSVGEEELLPQESSFKALELNEKSVAAAEIVGMKLLLEEAAVPEVVVVHRNDRVSVVSDSIQPGDTIRSSHNKRKDAGTLSVPSEKRSKVESRGVELDLNMPLDEDQAQKADDDKLFEEVEEAPGDQTSSQGDQVKLLLETARQQLSKQFCDKMSGTIVFRPYDFGKLAELAVSEINSAVSASAPEFSIEVESTLLKHLVAVLWECQGKYDEFQKWMKQVLETSISSLIKFSDQQQQQQQQHVIRLVADKSGMIVLGTS